MSTTPMEVVDSDEATSIVADVERVRRTISSVSGV